MTRYLVFVSYLGTRFRGIQKQTPKSSCFNDPFTVQGMLEIALKRYKPKNQPDITFSSRTDAGVHGLQNALHVDLESAGSEYDPHFLMSGINKYFERSDIAIRIQRCQIVPETFHARYNAIGRSYLYRLAVRKDTAAPLPFKNKEVSAPIPFNEWRRCYFIQNPVFDVENFISAARLLPGERDFRTFMGSVHNKDGEISSIRLLHSIDIIPGNSMQYCPSSSDYKYWDVVCKGRSFVFRQVRRMVGVLIAIAQGKLQISDLERMLAEPSINSWNPRALPAPAYGLYLLNVEYNPVDLIIDSGNNTKIGNLNEQT